MAKTYSFLNVAASLDGPGGTIALGAGAADSEEGITIAPTGPINGMTIGADGEGMHNLFADRSGKVTIRLLKTSPINALLGNMFAFQRGSASLHGQNTLVISDVSRAETVTCRQVAFAKAPDLSYAKEGAPVEWEFDAVRIDYIFGQ